MKRHVYCASTFSRQTFKDLLLLWFVVVALTIIAGVLLAASEAKADVVLPLPKAQKVFVPAVLRNFAPSPSPALVEERCHPHLNPRQTDSLIPVTTSTSRHQRNAESRENTSVEGIKAYRRCVSQIVLQQLAQQ